MDDRFCGPCHGHTIQSSKSMIRGLGLKPFCWKDHAWTPLVSLNKHMMKVITRFKNFIVALTRWNSKLIYYNTISASCHRLIQYCCAFGILRQVFIQMFCTNKSYYIFLSGDKKASCGILRPLWSRDRGTRGSPWGSTPIFIKFRSSDVLIHFHYGLDFILSNFHFAKLHN
jgi:hypothetical protein